MTERLLILEPDEQFAGRLVRTLGEIGRAGVTVAANTRDACLRLMEQPHHLAFVPLVQGDRIIRALRTIQPDLRLVVMSPTADDSVPESYAGRVQGVLFKTHLDADLATVLEASLQQPVPIEEATTQAMKNGPSLETATLIGALQQAKLGRLIQSAVFFKGSRVLAHYGELNATQAATVALQAGGDWENSPHSVRIQFIRLPTRAGDMIVYTQRVEADFLLTLVALPETPVSELRAQSDSLVAGLRDILAGRERLEREAPKRDGQANNRRSFAIVWRPVEPLPTSLHIPLRRAMARLAVANGCSLRYIEVQSELVHMVVTCPPGRDSAWAAYLFKNGSEATIQQEFNVEASLWDTGYYSAESTEPLSVAELNIFLEHQATP